MPTFTALNGYPIWFPAHHVLRAEPGDGGLTTKLTCIAPPGAPDGSALTCEVRGTVLTNGALLDDALRAYPSGVDPLGVDLGAR